MAISSTENAQCGVLTPAWIIYLSIGLNHVALPKNHRAHNSLFRIFFGHRSCLRAWPRIPPATGGWPTASPTSASPNATATCGAWWPGRRRRAASDKNNPDASKQSRPTLGMPILIDMKKKPGVDAWEGQVYNAKDGQLYSSTIKPVGTDQLEIQGCVLGFLCGGETWTRVGPPIPSSPANSMAKGAPKGPAGAAQDRSTAPAAPATARAAPKTTGCGQPAPLRRLRRSEAGGRPARRYRRYLPTPRYRAVCPLAPAGTAAPRRAW